MTVTDDRANGVGTQKMGERMAGDLYIQATDAAGNPHTITIAQFYNALIVSPDDNPYLVPEGTIANSFLAAP